MPVRELEVKDIDILFRGPMIPKLAEKINEVFGDCIGTVNAKLLWDASSDSELSFSDWENIGSKDQVFQYMKQLWHILGYFG